MSYKPDEAVLMAYLEGELSGEEETKVVAYLDAHPKEKEELEGILSVRKIMGKLPDKEVATPSFVFEDSATVVVSGSVGAFNGILKSTLAIAASISLLLLVGYFTEVRITSSESGMQLSFRDAEVPAGSSPSLSKDEIKLMMQEALASNNEELVSKINEVEDDFRARAEELMALNTGSENVDFQLDQDLLNEYVSQIKIENRDIILSLMEVTGRNQKEYMDDLMTDFATFVAAQREEDLNLIENSINSLVNNTDLGRTDEYRNSE